MPKIFVSYRRDDSGYVADIIRDRLLSAFGRNSIFMDIDDIPLGTDFRAHLESKVQECDVMLVLMGDHWFGHSSSPQNRRIDDPTDFVRIEVESALAREIPVIPILVGKAALPRPDNLPSSLQQLSFRQAAEVRSGVSLKSQIDLLTRRLAELEPAKARSSTAPQGAARDSNLSPVIRKALLPVAGGVLTIAAVFLLRDFDLQSSTKHPLNSSILSERQEPLPITTNTSTSNGVSSSIQATDLTQLETNTSASPPVALAPSPSPSSISNLVGGAASPPAASPLKQLYLGKHNISLQWISWEDFGSATITERDGSLLIEGEQKGQEDQPGNVMKSDYLRIRGRITPIDRNAFDFEGDILTKVHHINDGLECKRTGTYRFVAKNGRRYWRMEKMTNPCDAVTDYVDIFFK